MMDIINLLVMIICVLIVCIILMALFNMAAKSDEKNGRGKDAVKPKGKLDMLKVIGFVFVGMMAFVLYGYFTGLPYVSPLENLEQFFEIVANGSFSNFRK